ncbi:hypothetical protein [Actinoallomurus sp. NPDC050550]|uniref:hypothetical protein n=1 Tax=Actinoallomurus sp. NPDC050550 TaxID=3154937 RepID=UPI0033C02FEE
MSIESTPNIHPTSLLTAPDGVQADIDIDMVPLIKTLWSMGLVTTACCQDFGEGTEGQRRFREGPPRYGGDAFIEFYRGYAWLKMPTSNAVDLVNALLGTAFHARVTLRWRPGSWRIHAPLVYESGYGFRMAGSTQIHFPREEITELVNVLSERQLRD